MNLTINKPTILEMTVALDPEDRCYDLCSGAMFHFDCGNWLLTVTGDAGNYSYQWSHEDDRTFFELLAQASNEYLLRKLGEQVFNLKQSINQTLANLEGVFTEAQEPVIFKQIRALKATYAPESVFYFCAKAILTNDHLYQNKENSLVVKSDLDCFICLVKEYPSQVVAVVGVFDEYIRPELEKINRQ